MKRLMQRSKQQPHSITSSARPRSESGTVSPNALAVFVLMISGKPLASAEQERIAGINGLEPVAQVDESPEESVAGWGFQFR